jgi:hypothetical protein
LANIFYPHCKPSFFHYLAFYRFIVLLALFDLTARKIDVVWEVGMSIATP